jgi:hypothetical protein
MIIDMETKLTLNNRASHTLWGLTPREIIRLLHRYDLSQNMRDEIYEHWADLTSERYDNRDVIISSYNPIDAYLRANPVYGPENAPLRRGWDGDEDELPF